MRIAPQRNKAALATSEAAENIANAATALRGQQPSRQEPEASSEAAGTPGVKAADAPPPTEARKKEAAASAPAPAKAPVRSAFLLKLTPSVSETLRWAFMNSGARSEQQFLSELIEHKAKEYAAERFEAIRQQLQQQAS